MRDRGRCGGNRDGRSASWASRGYVERGRCEVNTESMLGGNRNAFMKLSVRNLVNRSRYCHHSQPAVDGIHAKEKTWFHIFGYLFEKTYSESWAPMIIITKTGTVFPLYISYLWRKQWMPFCRIKLYTTQLKYKNELKMYVNTAHESKIKAWVMPNTNPISGILQKIPMTLKMTLALCSPKSIPKSCTFVFYH